MSLHCFYAEVAAAVLPLWPQLECGQVCSENKLLTQKNRLKRRFFQVKWSEMGDSNSRPDGPKPMSEPSGRTESHSLALSVAPTVPLWNFFALFVSGTAFGFWDLYGMKFCILKVLPTRFTSDSRCFLPQRVAQKLRRINKEISPGNKHISRLPLNRDSLLNKNAYSMVCFSAAMRALLPENASPYLIIDLIPSACISAL